MYNLETNILIVDDMKTMRKLVRKGLMALGFKNFDEAEDGMLAWAKLNEPGTDFKLVISDWNMPNCTGIELLKKVRTDSKLKTLPFLLLTAEGETHQVKEAMMSGVDGYVLKPFTVELLKEQLEKAHLKRAA